MMMISIIIGDEWWWRKNSIQKKIKHFYSLYSHGWFVFQLIPSQGSSAYRCFGEQRLLSWSSFRFLVEVIFFIPIRYTLKFVVTMQV